MENIEEIHRQFTEYGQNAKEWIRKCQLLLPLVAKYEIWKEKNFSGIYEYAAKLAGMSKSSVDTALWVLRKVEDKPALLKVVEERGVYAVRPVANVATAEDQDFWAGKSRQMSVRALETYVRERKSLHVAKAQPEELDVSLRLRPDLARRVEQLKKDARFEARFKNFIEQLEEEFSKEVPEVVQATSRYISSVVRKYIMTRSGGYCEYPRCSKRFASLHHTQRFALERVHDPTRLVALCTDHERLMHHTLINNEEGAPATCSVRDEPDKMSARFWIDQMVALYR